MFAEEDNEDVELIQSKDDLSKNSMIQRSKCGKSLPVVKMPPKQQPRCPRCGSESRDHRVKHVYRTETRINRRMVCGGCDSPFMASEVKKIDN